VPKQDHSQALIYSPEDNKFKSAKSVLTPIDKIVSDIL